MARNNLGGLIVLEIPSELQIPAYSVISLLLLIVSIPVHEPGHWLSYRLYGIEAEILWLEFKTRAVLDSAAAMQIWMDNWIFFSAAGGLLAFVVFLPITLKIHPFTTGVAWTHLIYAVLEPVNTWSTRLGLGETYCDIAVSAVSVAFGFTIALLITVLWRSECEK